MTTDALKFFQAYIKEMINIGGENFPKTISSGLGANLAKLYKSKGINDICTGLKESYKVLGSIVEVNQLSDDKIEVSITYHEDFCPIGGKYDPEKADLIQKSICTPYTGGFLNELNSEYKYSAIHQECILKSRGNSCKYTLTLEKKNNHIT